MFNTPKSDMRSAERTIFFFTKKLKIELIYWSCPNIGAVCASLVNNPEDL